MQIKEIIVVEGKNDTRRLKSYFDCETIETGGLALDDATIELIAAINKKRGVIVFTDPDSPGDKIRNRLNSAIPGLKNAFVLKKDARTTKKVGIEHADKETLEAALNNLISFDSIRGVLTINDLCDLGLCGGAAAAERREVVAEVFHVGKCNAKTLLKRLNLLGIEKEELKKVLK